MVKELKNLNIETCKLSLYLENRNLQRKFENGNFFRDSYIL